MYNKLPSNEELFILDNQNVQTHWVKIEVLDSDEILIEEIQGRILPGGSMNLDSSSSLRRSISLSFVVSEDDSIDLTNIGNILSMNKRIRILEGIENDGILPDYPDIIWIPLGIFIINQPGISYSSSGLTVTLSCKDKMCLLNGEMGGSFPTSITFDSYDQIIGYREINGFPSDPNDYTVYNINGKCYMWDKDKQQWDDASYSAVGTTVSVPQKIYDIIQTVVCNYGGIPISKIFINDIDLELKQLVRFTGSGNMYYNQRNGIYTVDSSAIVSNPHDWRVFNYNEDVGYIYTDFTYPGELVTAIGDNVCTVLDKIISVLGNYEYFFDIDGNFVFQEIKNYLNNSYDPTVQTRLDNGRKVELLPNGLSILDNANYQYDVKSNSKSVYTFAEGNGLINSYSNTPSYTNIKNDFHIWGKDNDKNVIHYHVAIKRKPTKFNTYSVAYLTDKDGNYNGKVRLMTEDELKQVGVGVTNETLVIPNEGGSANPTATVDGDETINFYNNAYVNIEDEILVIEGVAYGKYTPKDWRAELYMQGLTKVAQQQRPDVYEQELLDLFDAIYDMKEQKFKTDIVEYPNELKYFFDYLEPADSMFDYSVDLIGTKIKSYQQDKVKRLYSTDVPNLILINMEAKNREKTIKRCEQEGQAYSNVNASVYKAISIGTAGYSAQETMRSLLYQHTSYNESISISCVPIYHLDVNSRITVEDEKSNIHGDFIIKTLSMPLGGQGTMSITATRALERI